jgi:hypothetical protein
LVDLGLKPVDVDDNFVTAFARNNPFVEAVAQRGLRMVSFSRAGMWRSMLAPLDPLTQLAYGQPLAVSIVSATSSG